MRMWSCLLVAGIVSTLSVNGSAPAGHDDHHSGWSYTKGSSHPGGTAVGTKSGHSGHGPAPKGHSSSSHRGSNTHGGGYPQQEHQGYRYKSGHKPGSVGGYRRHVGYSDDYQQSTGRQQYDFSGREVNNPRIYCEKEGEDKYIHQRGESSAGAVISTKSYDNYGSNGRDKYQEKKLRAGAEAQTEYKEKYVTKPRSHKRGDNSRGWYSEYPGSYGSGGDSQWRSDESDYKPRGAVRHPSEVSYQRFEEEGESRNRDRSTRIDIDKEVVYRPPTYSKRISYKKDDVASEDEDSWRADYESGNYHK